MSINVNRNQQDNVSQGRDSVVMRPTALPIIRVSSPIDNSQNKNPFNPDEGPDFNNILRRVDSHSQNLQINDAVGDSNGMN